MSLKLDALSRSPYEGSDKCAMVMRRIDRYFDGQAASVEHDRLSQRDASTTPEHDKSQSPP
ncbi:hypothetical protein [Streptomyces yerevanensis]|uniref:hypothetical protein n=1 Tax=Streptomyces yerevanensis TaxID=66378 RepID=UPI000B2C6670|nr:hypothetical protein [Streptomyces yerevanensis]